VPSLRTNEVVPSYPTWLRVMHWENLTFNIICHGKVKFTLEQATSTQRESRDVAVSFL